MTAKLMRVLVPDADTAGKLTEQLLKLLPNISISVKRCPQTGMFSVKFPTTKEVLRCNIPQLVQCEIGGIGYQEYYLTVMLSERMRLFRVWLDSDIVYSDKDADILAGKLANFKGEACAEAAFLTAATELNSNPIRVGPNCELL